MGSYNPPPPKKKKKWKETLRFPIMETFPQAAPTPARAPRASEIRHGSAEAKMRRKKKTDNGFGGGSNRTHKKNRCLFFFLQKLWLFYVLFYVFVFVGWFLCVLTIVELQFKTSLHLGEAAYFPKFPTSVLATLKLQASRSKPANEAENVSKAREATTCRVNGEDGTTQIILTCAMCVIFLSFSQKIYIYIYLNIYNDYH